MQYAHCILVTKVLYNTSKAKHFVLEVVCIYKDSYDTIHIQQYVQCTVGTVKNIPIPYTVPVYVFYAAASSLVVAAPF